MSKTIPQFPPNRYLTVGILGGGQLALMLARAASQFGVRIRVLESGSECPAKRSALECVEGSWKDRKTLQQFASACDLITLENEFIDSDLLRALEEDGHTVLPSSHTMRLVQDKLIQKQTLRAGGVPVVDFLPVENEAEARAALAAFHCPAVLKRRTLGYDGTGNFTVSSETELMDGVQRLGGFEAGLYLERWCEFEKELAVIVTRGRDGKSVVYPVVETVQRNHVCSAVVVPAPVSDALAERVRQVGLSAVEALDGVGSFGVEFFLAKNGELLINEMAPRVHNSGHYTIEACDCSQFENHMRAVLGLPLGETKLRSPAAMVNLLATQNANGYPNGLSEAMNVSGACVHLYGKLTSKPGRKMGHVTALAADTASALAIAETAAKKVTFQ